MNFIRFTPWDSGKYSWVSLRIYYIVSGFCKLMDGLIQLCSFGVLAADFTGRLSYFWVNWHEE